MEAGTTQLRQVPFDSDRWSFTEALPTPAEYLGRPCVHLGTSTATLADANFADGVIEVDLAVGPGRGFHGCSGRARDDENFESLFVRPHQVGNPDAVQYTPVFNGLRAGSSIAGRASGPRSRFRWTSGSASASPSPASGPKCS